VRIGSPRVLVVEDDEAIADAVRYGLQSEGFDVDVISDGNDAVDAPVEDFDAIVLDVMLPGRSGVDVCRQIRSRSTVPILMLTARTTELDRVVGLEVGADDYVPKPFSMAELKARIDTILRRQQMERARAPAVLKVGPLELDLLTQSVSVDGRPVALTATEFRLLALLARQPERTVSRRQIMEHLWRSEHVGDTRTLDAHVKNLRRKIEPDPGRPQLLATVRGIGYQLRAT
jgi:two-component system, OmpR family, response regulator RegX3